MVVDPEIRQRLLELIYDVLPEDEALQLRRRIETEPEIARAFAQVQATAGLLAQAARLDEPKMELKRPEAPSLAVPVSEPIIATAVAPKRETVRVKPAARSAHPLRRPRMRGMTWLVSLSAGVLLMISLGGYFYHRGQLSDIAADHLRLRVVGPSHLQPWAGSRYTIETTSVTGNPVSAPVQFALYSSNGQQLMGHKERTDEKGRLEVAVPPDLPALGEARLEIEAALADKVERVDTRLAVDSPHFTTYLTTDRPVFRPGETVRYRSVTLAGLGLSPERRVPLRYEILDPSGSIVPGSTLQATARDGVGSGRMVLPANASEGAYSLIVRSPDRRFPEQRCSFVVRRQLVSAAKGQPEPALPTGKPGSKVLVQFYPEGGELIDGLQNRVFFRATDPEGRPVEIRGTILDSRSSTIGSIESVHEGMGAFVMEPKAGQQYRLKIVSPEKIVAEPLLPPVIRGEVVLTTGLGVFPAGKPLEFNVRALTPGIPLVAAAFCRGADVGQTALVTKAGPNSVEIPLDESASGVIRLAIYDYRSSPPKPVGERLVYRRPAQRLQIQTADIQASTPGEPVKMSVAVRDEKGNPVPATLSVSVVDQSVLKVLDGQNMSMAGYFLLGSQLEPEPKNLDFYCSEDPKAAAALDLLLGAQGRRPARAVAKSAAPQSDIPADRLVLRAATLPPAVFDNLAQLQERYKDTLASYRANRTRPQNSLTMLSLFGGLGLVLFVAMLAIMNVPTGLRLWVPTLSAATACVVIGAILMNPERLQSMSSEMVAFASYSAPPPVGVAAKSGPAPPTLATINGQLEASLERADGAPAEILDQQEKAKEKASVLAADAPKGQAATVVAPAAAAPPAAPPPAQAPPVLPAANAPPASVAQSLTQPEMKSPATGPAPATAGAAGAMGPPAERLARNAPMGHASGKVEPETPREHSEQRSAGRPPALKANRAPSDAPAASAEPLSLQRPPQEQPLPLQSQSGQKAAAGVLLWNPLMVAGKDGRAEVQFNLPAGAGQCRVIVDAYVDGRLGSVEVTIPVKSP